MVNNKRYVEYHNILIDSSFDNNKLEIIQHMG